jgi:hypothetical protein
MRHGVPGCLLLLAVVGSVACVGPEDRPSHVKDLRVLGVQVDPPELMAAQCPDFSDPEAIDPLQLAAFLQPIRYRALIADPEGADRELRWDLWACAGFGNRDCDAPEDRARLSGGTTGPGVLEHTVQQLALTVLPGPDRLFDDPETPARESEDDVPLLQRVWELDPYRGFGGLRVPLMLHLRAGQQAIWASKLMVFNCPLVEGMVQNVNPELPGLLLDGVEWEQAQVPQLRGPGPFELVPLDFADRQERYIVPSFELQPIELEERWELAWYADFGELSSNRTGGADLGGGERRHRVEWSPPEGDGAEREVRFWIVVRDGRGGQSWLTRTARYLP